MNRYIVSHVTFPATSYLYNRKNIRKHFKNLIKAEHISAEQAAGLQLKKLQRLVAYLDRSVPFYRRRFQEIGFSPGDLKTLDDLKNIPPLTRAEVIDHHREMVAYHYQDSVPFADNRKGDPGTPVPFAPFRRHKLVRNTSSGSTGAPTIFYEDGSRTALNWVHEMRLKYWFGIPPGSKEARLVRLSVDYDPQNRVIQTRKKLWNQFLLPGTNLADSHYEMALQHILEFKPRVLWGFPSAIAGLANYVNRHKPSFNGYRPDLAIGWAGPVYEHEEKEIKQAFDCAVSNNYGAREVGHVAGRCPAGNFHINQENVFVESEPRDDIDKHHEVGELLATTLDITPMPFLRYRMGDIGKVTPSNCSCGRTLPLVSGFMGRTGEIFIAKDGRMISPNFWCRFFFVNQFSNAIRRFQVIYRKDKNLKIIIERDRKYSEETETYIREGVSKNFSSDTELELAYVPKIEPQLSGKYQMVVNEANR